MVGPIGAEGGWFPLLLPGHVAFLMLTWRRRAQLVKAARAVIRLPEPEFLEQVRARWLPTVPEAAVFINGVKDGMPLSQMAFARTSTPSRNGWSS